MNAQEWLASHTGWQNFTCNEVMMISRLSTEDDFVATVLARDAMVESLQGMLPAYADHIAAKPSSRFVFCTDNRDGYTGLIELFVTAPLMN